jgi:hypothetical protein
MWTRHPGMHANSATTLPPPAEALHANPPPLSTRANLLEFVAVFLAGFFVLQFFYHHPNPPNRDEHGRPVLGVPEHDSWYHMRMAMEIPSRGFIGELPWLQYGYLDPSDKTGRHFVSHHVGFQVLLIPFLYVSKWITGEHETGARWAMATFFGLICVLYDMLLISGRVRGRALWLAAVLLLPNHFFLRHAFIRSMSPSLMLMLLIVLALVRERPRMAFLACTAYALLYLGSLPFAPLIIGTYAACCWVAPAGERRFPSRLVLAALGGVLLGFLLYPYGKRAMLEFLRLQIFGTGLGADIEVGLEWLPYNGAWWFARMAGPLLVILIAAMVVRTREARPIDAATMTLLLLNFGFLVLNLKARRFVEYWPAFALLAAAYLTAPLTQRAGAAWDRWWHPATSAGGTAPRDGRRQRGSGADATAAALPADGPTTPPALSAAMAATLWLAIIAVAVGLRLYWLRDHKVVGPLLPNYLGNAWILAAAIVMTAAAILRDAIRTRDWRWAVVQAPPFALLGGVTLVALTFLNGGQLLQTRDELRCTYRLNDVKAALAFIRNDSQPGDIVFTDDWDDFGLFFYHNPHNYYIVGLDPKFTHERRPDLWERFIKITRGQVPTESTVQMPDGKGGRKPVKIQIALEDIATEFKARYVICDSSHQDLSRQLAKATHFAELAYPGTDYEKVRNAPYLVFRIRPPTTD